MTTAVAFVWLDEIPAANDLVGGAVIIAGVVLIGRRGARPRSGAARNDVPLVRNR